MGHQRSSHLHPRVVGLAAVVSLAALASPAHAAKPTADELLASATAELTYFNFDDAADLFEQAGATAYRGSALWQRATFGQAVAVQQGTPATVARAGRAEALYEELVAAAPDGPMAARSLLHLGRLAELSDYYRDPIDLPKARDYYKQVAEQFPTDPIAGEATLRLAAAYVQTYQPDDVRHGVAILEAWVGRHTPATEPLLSAMYQYLGDTYFFPLGDDRKALDAYARADRIGWVDDADIGRVLWRMARLAERVKDRDAAVRYYTKIVTHAAASGKPSEAQGALRRLGAPVPEINLILRRPDAATPTAPPTTAPAATAPANLTAAPTRGGVDGPG